MLKWIKSFLAPRPAAGAENELQLLRLELAEREKIIAQLKADLDRQRRAAEGAGAASLDARLEQLFVEAAAPVAQLHTQAHLLEAENRPVQARDVLAVAKRLARVLEDHGLSLDQRLGAEVAFDPDLHTPLSAGEELRPGQKVVVRFVGVAFRGKLLRRAGVEAI